MDAQQVFNQMLKQPGAEFEFVVERSLETTDRDGLGVGISAAAMESLNQQMMSWVGTRMLRFDQERGVMPQRVSVVMTVSLEV